MTKATVLQLEQRVFPEGKVRVGLDREAV